MEIHQVLVGAAFGDAITNEAIGLRAAIRAAFPGVASEIYAHHRQQNLPDIRPLSGYPARGATDAVLVFHSSIGEAAVGEFLAARDERVVVRYHNITPPEFFQPYAPEFAELLALGRRQLFGLRDRSALAIADSGYNQQELIDAGFKATVVVPIHADLAALKAARSEPPKSYPLARHEDEPVVLFVGRVAPNKGHVRLMQSFHVLKTYRQYEAHLWMVGGASQPLYSRLLDQYRRELGLTDTYFSGTVSVPELAYVYRRASVFLCLSEHEGFCVPLLEAMAFDVPIVALARAAVPETLGGAGLLIDGYSPEVVAEAVSTVIDDAAVRQALVERGRRRFAELAPERADEAFVAALRRVVA
ncbi:MAG TPA: glycosyltransferase [Candidatus Dormibacteraeota bacterium]